MREGQGWTKRRTFLEAIAGKAAAGDLIQFFSAKMGYFELQKMIFDALSKLKEPSVVQICEINRLEIWLKTEGEEIGALTLAASNQEPTFLKNWAEVHGALKSKLHLYPAETRMFVAYVQLQFKAPYESALEEVSYQELFEATQDEDGNPSASTFSRMFQRYKRKLPKVKKDKPGRSQR